MKAIVITRPGGPEVLDLVERPVPIPQEGEVLIKVIAAGINRPDIAQRKGNYPPPAGAPQDIPGLEIAGLVVDAGKNSTRWKTGDKVCALTIGGGYAGYCAVPEGQCLPAPEFLSMIEAASLPETWMTVWSNVFDRGKLAAGETLLVHGGSGGIGSTAIQLATAAGARVFATAGDDGKCAYCKKLGASVAINYKKENFKDSISQLTTDRTINVVLDMIGGDYTNDNLEVLSADGRLILINYMKGEEATIKLGHILRKRLVISGSTLRTRSIEFKAALAAAVEKHAWPWLNSGRIKPLIDCTFPLERAADAHRLMESGSHMGKIVLTVS